jgi:hypothetical protein
MAATAGHISLVEPPVRAPAEPERRGERGSRAVWVIALCCLAAALRLGREALIPLGLAVLVACVLSGAVEGLRRWRVPRALSAMLLLVLLSLGLAATIDLIASPAQAWLQKSPQVLRTIEQKARPAQSIVRRLDYIARRATALASAVGGGTSAPASPAPAAPAASLTAIDIFAATGSAQPFSTDEDDDADFNDLDPDSVDEDMRRFLAQCDVSRSIVEGADSLEQEAANAKDAVALRWIMVHMIEEYARHNGHADLLREQIDGAVGE